MVRTTPINWSQAKCLKWQRKFVQYQEHAMFQRCREKCTGLLVQPEISPSLHRISLSSGFEGMASWLGASGVVRVLESMELGWTHIQLAFRFWHWADRIRLANAKASKRALGGSRRHVAACLVHAIATDDRATADWCGRNLIESYTWTRWLKDAWTEYLYFCCLLYGRYSNTPVTLPESAKLGLYGTILSEWNDPPRLSVTLREACQWHVERSGWNGEEESAESLEREFVINPVLDYPAEIIAILAQRRREGIVDEIAIDHPLAQTPLMHPPVPMPVVEDDLLNRVIARVSADLPGL